MDLIYNLPFELREEIYDHLQIRDLYHMMEIDKVFERDITSYFERLNRSLNKRTYKYRYSNDILHREPILLPILLPQFNFQSYLVTDTEDVINLGVEYSLLRKLVGSFKERNNEFYFHGDVEVYNYANQLTIKAFFNNGRLDGEVKILENASLPYIIGQIEKGEIEEIKTYRDDVITTKRYSSGLLDTVEVNNDSIYYILGEFKINRSDETYRYMIMNYNDQSQLSLLYIMSPFILKEELKHVYVYALGTYDNIETYIRDSIRNEFYTSSACMVDFLSTIEKCKKKDTSQLSKLLKPKF